MLIDKQTTSIRSRTEVARSAFCASPTYPFLRRAFIFACIKREILQVVFHRAAPEKAYTMKTCRIDTMISP